MRRTENAELRRKVLNHLADLYNIKEVREHNHLSSYITCRTKSFLNHKQAAEPNDDEVMMFALGYGLQDVLTPKDAEAPLIAKHGILYRPDMILSVRQNEIKTTRKSAKNHYLDEYIPQTWLDYMMGGCYLMDTNEYDLIVLYMMGNYCLHPDTLILKADLTWIHLSSLKVGDEIVGLDEYPDPGVKGKRRKLRRATVTSLGTRVLPSRRIYLSDGREVVSSNEHLWLQQIYLGEQSGMSHYSPDWTKTIHLKEGNRIRQLCEPWETIDSYDAGWIAGILDGEGSLEHHHGMRVGFSQKDNIVALQAQRILDEELGIYLTPSHHSSGVISFRTQNMTDTLKLLGSVRPVRLLQNLRWEGVALPQHNSAVEIDYVKDIGDTEVITIGTSTRTLIANGFISHNSPPFPQLYCDTFYFDKMDLEGNWEKIMRNKKILDDAVESGVPPAPFVNCHDWECKFCRYTLVCNAIVTSLGVENKSLKEDQKQWQ